MKKNTAFTLAEVLIVIAIIGVVSTLTMTNLSSSTDDKVIVAKVTKVTRDINEAYTRARAKYGTFVNSDKWVASKHERITEFMQIQQNCSDITKDNDCVKNSAKDFNGTTVGFSCSGKASVLADGTSIAISDGISAGASGAITCNAIPDTYNSGGVAVIDIDGPQKGNNLVGEDVFFVLLSKDGGIASSDVTLPATLAFLDSQKRTLASRLLEAPAYAATGWGKAFKYNYWAYTNYILKNGNVDYLHPTKK